MVDLPGILEASWTRRRFLHFGMAATIAAQLNQTQAAGATSSSATPTKEPIRSCIFVMLYGGPSHLDTWDMKPHAPIEIRGHYQPISTRIPGRVVSEHLPRCAQLLDRLAVIRSMHHGMGNHNSAMYQALVGRRPKIDLDVLGANRSEDFPCIGSSLSYLRASGILPPASHALTHVALPHVMHNVVDLPGQNAGFLGGQYDPLQIAQDPNSTDFRVPNLQMANNVDLPRIMSRLDLLHRFEDRSNTLQAESWRAYHARAVDLLQNRRVQQAFRLEDEPASVRDRYGRHTLGQSFLLARKLVEAEVRFINVHDKVYNGQLANWDSHENLFPRHAELLPPFDQGFSALIEDLHERSLLDSTLVVVTGEFGRTPRVNGNAGRDHWPDCYSVVLAGGGVAGGSAYGESDRTGAYPVAQATTPADLLATILWRFGVDWQHEVRDPLGRPLPLTEGSPLTPLF